MSILTIKDVLIQLDTIILNAESNGSRQAYFAVLYRRMTQAVLDASDKSNFEDKARMEKLDVNFALRYIEAVDAYATNKPLSAAWKFAFDSCQQTNLTVIQHLLLGINTHINLDLAIAAAETSPGEGIFALRKDYDLINDTIASLVDEVQDKLTKVWWPLFFLRKIANHRQDAVVNFSISAARKAAWANAVALCNSSTEARANYIHGIDRTVTSIAEKITRPGLAAGFVLKLVRWLEYKDVKRIIALIK